MTSVIQRARRFRLSRLFRVGLWAGAVVILAVVVLIGVRIRGQASSASPDLSVLVGQWVRVDGGYVLELSGPGPDGVLKATYSNPRPIHVAQAQWKQQGDVLGVFVELRDQGYPGSTYTLNYHVTEDRLVGIYYQATLKQQFEVAFNRRK